ncbi:caspase family protein [Paenibacillus sp. FSL R7-0272]|uniref:caspase family protein n=1 Tax=Paenibacillus sp. FSL R7-0272 TaxID=2921679 RepID=UPI0030EEBC79
MNKALIIGVNKYEHFKDLMSVEYDVKCMSETLDKHFEDMNIKEVTGIKAKSQFLKLELEYFLKNCSSQDTLILYWAGHGEVYNQKGYLLTSDSIDDDSEFNKIPMSTLTEWIEESPAKAILVLVDCCKSGYLTRSGSNNSIDTAISNELVIRGKGRIIITAANDENAYSLEDNSNGFFTHAFLMNLDLYIKELNEQNDNVDITQLYSMIVKDMEDGYYKQVPCMKASIEGRFLLKLKSASSFKNTNISRKNIPLANLTRGGIKQIESLEEVFRGTYLDHRHFMGTVVKYVGLDLLAAKVVEVVPHVLMENFFHLKIEWFNWVQFSKIGLMRESYVLKLDRSEAEVIFKLVNDKKCFVNIRFSIINENLNVERLSLKIEKKEISFPRNYTRNRTNKFAHSMEEHYSWIFLTKDERYLITFDNNNNLSKWRIEDREKLQTINLKSESDELLIVGYSSIKETILAVEIVKEQYVYYLFNFLGEIIYTQKLDEGVLAYFPDSGDYIIFYHKTELMFVALSENEDTEKMFKFKKVFFARRQYPLFCESTEEIFVFNYNRFLVFNRSFEYLKEIPIQDENVSSILNSDLLLAIKGEYVQVFDVNDKTKKYPQIKLNENYINSKHNIVSNYYYIGYKKADIYSKEKTFEIIDLTLNTSNNDLFLIDGELKTVLVNKDKSFIAVLTKDGKIRVWE